ncbi:MAG TPA: hypothetical protein VFH66_14220 [Mycobacteriales bacterium]|nr:hypothetical protein [Mycobacteriales bacterium]
MAACDGVTVEIWRGHARVASCSGPDDAGGCSAAAPPPVEPLCAGAELLVRTAPDDCWHFTVSSAARGCPLAWLVSAPDAWSDDELFDPRLYREERGPVFGR